MIAIDQSPVLRKWIAAAALMTVALPATLAARPSEAQRRVRTGWVRLGEKHVDGRRDRDTIDVDRRGRFRQIMFRVTDDNARIDNVVVHFDNGRSFSPAVRQTFRRGTSSRPIDLPGFARNIDRITFRYENIGRGRGADVVVFGRR